jgi:peptidoglycan lytic transglycosylase D
VIRKEKEEIMKSKYLFFLLGFVMAACILLIFSFLFLTENKVIGKSEDFPQGYRIISPEIPMDLSFAGERVPIENFEVYERIDREFLVNTYFHSYTILSIKRAERWFPVVEPILKEYNVPDDFKYISIIESGLANVVSPVGATGFWQLTEESAKKYGLEVNSQVDERYYVEKSTEAACKYILDAHNEFKTWTMAAAAYNFGTNGIENQIAKQKATNYYNLVFGDETSRYVARIIAAKEILSNPKKYGFDIKSEDLYQPLLTISMQINYSIPNLADFAIRNGFNYKILKMYNPWLRDTTLTVKNNKTYVIKLPEKGSIKIIDE